jgi:hypothetical protein
MNGIDTIVSTVNCIKPDKTKIWKLLVFCAEAEENTAIKEIGYY